VGVERDEQAVAQFVEAMAMTFADWGFPRMAARILMMLMTADEEALTAAELAERLGVSPPAISGAVRYLVQVGLLERRPVPGSRRDHYRMRDDAWYASSATKREAYKALADLADDGVRAVGAGSVSGARVGEMRDFFRFAHDEMVTLVEKWRRSRQP
jgi:DNA-binding transcriptional regulator GbsR (MarR family)